MAPTNPAPQTSPTQPQPFGHIPRRILRLPEVEGLVGLKKSALYALIREGKFPQSVRLSARAVGWREAEIDAWIASREQGQPAATLRAG